jgi:hypothetical protein
MKKKLLVLLCAPLFWGCPGDDLDIVANERLYAEGIIRVKNEGPAANIDISISENSGVLGEGRTDASGAFSFVSLKSSDPTIRLSVNKSTDSLLSQLAYIAFDTSLQEYIVPDAILEPVGYLNFTLTKNSPSTPTLFYRFDYKVTFCEQALNGINPNPETPICYDTANFYGNIGVDGETTQTIQLRSLRSDPVVFTYKIGEEGVENTITIPLINATTSYEFDY